MPRCWHRGILYSRIVLSGCRCYAGICGADGDASASCCAAHYPCHGHPFDSGRADRDRRHGDCHSVPLPGCQS